jgi:hypothetical protein
MKRGSIRKRAAPALLCLLIVTWFVADLGIADAATFQQADAVIEMSKVTSVDRQQIDNSENASEHQTKNVSDMLQERRNATFAPVTVSLGGYYRAHPITYSTSLSDSTSLKDLSAGSSMVQETRFARAVDRSISLQAMESNVKGEGIVDFEGELSRISMSVEEDVTEGQAHLGVLQGSGQRGNAWRDPSVEIDQDYFGTFRLQTNASLGQPQETLCIANGWMPCCPAGYLCMPEFYHKAAGNGRSSTWGLFDPKISTPFSSYGPS